jgi:hypothetical protein
VGLEQDIENIIHPIQERVAKALTDAEAEFATEKAAIAGEVRAALTAGEAAAKAALPGLEADAVAAARAVEAAVEAALAARGL